MLGKTQTQRNWMCAKTLTEGSKWQRGESFPLTDVVKGASKACIFRRTYKKMQKYKAGKIHKWLKPCDLKCVLEVDPMEEDDIHLQCVHSEHEASLQVMENNSCWTLLKSANWSPITDYDLPGLRSQMLICTQRRLGHHWHNCLDNRIQMSKWKPMI